MSFVRPPSGVAYLDDSEHSGGPFHFFGRASRRLLTKNTARTRQLASLTRPRPLLTTKGGAMAQYRTVKFAIRSILIAMPLLSAVSWADTTKLEGLIIGRSGSTMIVQTKDTPSLLVLLTDTTKVGQIQGVLQARKKEMSMAALVPGLAVRIEGNYGGPN